MDHLSRFLFPRIACVRQKTGFLLVFFQQHKHRWIMFAIVVISDDNLLLWILIHGIRVKGLNTDAHYTFQIFIYKQF